MDPLRIRLARGLGKPPVLTCIRADGSTTWHRLHPATALHDLTHFAVETELELSDGVFGLVARGWDLDDFESPERRSQLPPAAIWEEFVVALLLAEASDGREDGAEEFNASLATSLSTGGRPPGRALSGPELARIRAWMRDLAGRWAAIRPGEALELVLHSAEQST